MSATAVGPDLQTFSVPIRQSAAGRYVGQFNAQQAGSYFLTIDTGTGGRPILTGVNVPYSAEFRDHQTNRTLLSALAELRPRGGQPGVLMEGGMSRQELDALLQVDTFRHNLPKAVSGQPVWPLFALLAVSVFFADVLVRRVALSFAWVAPAMERLSRRLLRRPPDEKLEEGIKRLRLSKAAVTEQIEERRAAARFEPELDAESGQPAAARDLQEALDQPAGPEPLPRTSGRAAGPQAPAEEEISYTDRLLKAKREAWKDKQP
jgi:hypothetical protein